MELKQQWFEIVIADELFLSGISLIKLFKIMQNEGNFNYIFMVNLEGAPFPGRGNDSRLIEEHQLKLIKLDSIFDCLKSVYALDWGDFYFFKEYSNEWCWDHVKKYPGLIQKSDTIVRAVDTNYYYIHTPYSKVKNAILKNYYLNVETLRLEPLAKHVYPD